MLRASLTKVQMMIQSHMDEQDDRDPIAVGMCWGSLREVQFEPDKPADRED
jgi:hypothetical protein